MRHHIQFDPRFMRSCLEQEWAAVTIESSTGPPVLQQYAKARSLAGASIALTPIKPVIAPIGRIKP
jgi:hypothetical protein